MLPCNKRSTSRGAALLGVVIGEECSFFCDAVDVRRSAPHQAAVVGADIPHADIVGHDDQNVRFFLLSSNGRCCHSKNQGSSYQRESNPVRELYEHERITPLCVSNRKDRAISVLCCTCIAHRGSGKCPKLDSAAAGNQTPGKPAN